MFALSFVCLVLVLAVKLAAYNKTVIAVYTSHPTLSIPTYKLEGIVFQWPFFL
jgi:hypothetical protein